MNNHVEIIFAFILSPVVAAQGWLFKKVWQQDVRLSELARDISYIKENTDKIKEKLDV